MKPNLTVVIKDFTMELKKHSPQILTGIGIAGMIITTGLAVKATPKALELIEEAKESKEVEEDNNDEVVELDSIEVIKVAWKPYIPAIISGVASTICLIGACSVNTRRMAVLASAYKISEAALNEYKEAVVETVGKKKAKDVKDKIAETKVTNNPVNTDTVIVTNKGNTLCYDSFSGRYFRSDMNTIKKAENELNACLRNENYISLNAVYDMLDLDRNELGSRLGWNIDRVSHYLIEIEISTQVAKNGEPCLVIDFSDLPTYDFMY